MIIRKIFGLLKKITNPPFFYYSISHYLKKDVSILVARKIWNSNKRNFLKHEKDFILTSYDGSNQFVHPDAVFFEGKYWFVATPYPYGMEEYENPSIYYGKDLDSLIGDEFNPLDRQEKHEIGFHLSDPCIFEFSENLICVYRENTRYSGIENNTLYYKKMSDNGIWSKRCLITKSIEDKLLSPALYVEKTKTNEILHMQHVKCIDSGSCLVHSTLDSNLRIVTNEICHCRGIPEEYYIWHVAVAYEKGMKTGSSEDKKYGLFLLRSHNEKDINKLFLCCSENNSTWIMLKEIATPGYLSGIIFHPYKSCFIPNTSKIIYSYIDKKNRYRMSVIDLLSFNKTN